MRIDVVPFGHTDDEAASQAYRICRASWLVDIPDTPPWSAHAFLSAIRSPFPGHTWERAIGYLDGKPVGYLDLGMPSHDNLDNATVEILVDPAARRNGVGRALNAHAVARVRELGRKRLTGETGQRRPDGDAFATAMGATPALTEVRSRLDIATLDQDRLAGMLAEAWTHAAGYRVVMWRGMPPDRFIDDVAYLDGRLFSDAPMGVLDWEPEKVDADRIRAAEEHRLARGFDRFHAGMEHIESGRLVAWTVLAGHPDTPTHLRQNITIVDPPHRGHRLGMIVKLENLRQAMAYRPALAVVDTHNAASNEPMLAINTAIGFQRLDVWTQWQQTV